jgi:hypothetical protein
MRYRLAARDELDAKLAQLHELHLVDIRLAALGDLLSEPDVDPMELRAGTPRAGIDDLAATVLAARRLPHELTVRVVLPDGASTSASIAETEAAFRRMASDRAAVAWRDGAAQRAMGLRQLPIGLPIAAVSWIAAYVLGYLATQFEGAGVGLLVVSAMVAITIAWVVSWMVVETAMLDWRFDARRAAAYDLLSRARLVFTTERSRTGELG